MKKMKKIIRKTYSVCPVCLKRIPAVHAAYGKEIYLEKICPDHGAFSSIIWRGFKDISLWRGNVPVIGHGENLNCPHGCGLCSEHRQDTCCVLLEITKRCNLKCSFCFADDGNDEEPPFEMIYSRLKELVDPGKTLVQLSGGEPTVRKDLPQIIEAAKDVGCQYVQLNTNGIKLAEDGYVQSLAEAGLSFVFMQFDGTDDKIYKKLRGKELLDTKSKAIENCGRHNVGVTLVPTLVPGINTSDIGNILRFALSKAPAVRGVHFQPVSYFGRIPTLPTDDMRFTLDELVYEIYEQASDIVPESTLLPSCCDHPLCGFHGNYIAMSDNKLHPLHRAEGNRAKGNCCIENNENAGGEKYATAEQNRLFIAKRWQRPEPVYSDYESTCDIETLEGFLQRVRSHSFTITAMVFQDAGNIDLERLRRCSLHVYDNGRHIPFCAYYLTKQQ